MNFDKTNARLSYQVRNLRHRVQDLERALQEIRESRQIAEMPNRGDPADGPDEPDAA
jgi:hypothetical protein